MKLIMEAWRKTLSEYDLYGTAFLDADLDAESLRTGASLENLENWYYDLNGIARFMVDILDPTGLTDWPDAKYAFQQYLDWYLLPDGDPEKDPIDGATLFANAVLMLILAVPAVDLVGIIGFQAVKGFGKLKDVLPRKDTAQEIIIWMLESILKIIKFLGYAVLSYGLTVLNHLGGTYKVTEQQRLKVVDMAKKAKEISDKQEELRQLNIERTRAAARAAKRTKEKRKEDYK